MTKKQQFESLLQDKKPPGVSQASLDAAKEYALDQNWLERKVPHECARDVINLAMRIDTRVAADRSSRSDNSPFERIPLTPETLMMSDDRAEKISAEVEQVRHTLFGSHSPPFERYEDAVQWSEQTAAAQEAAARANDQEQKALKQVIFEKLEEWQTLTGDGWQAPFVPELLEYAKPGDQWVHRLCIRGRTSLAELGGASRQMAAATGFSQASVVAYILAGIRPLLAPISISTSWGYSYKFSISRRRAIVEFYTPNITDAQLKTIRKVIRRESNTERKKPLTEADKQFLDIVRRLGGMPKDKGEGQLKAFYELVRQEYSALADEHGWQPLSSWQVTKRKHERLLKKRQQGYPRRTNFTRTEFDL